MGRKAASRDPLANASWKPIPLKSATFMSALKEGFMSLEVLETKPGDVGVVYAPTYHEIMAKEKAEREAGGAGAGDDAGASGPAKKKKKTAKGKQAAEWAPVAVEPAAPKEAPVADDKTKKKKKKPKQKKGTKPAEKKVEGKGEGEGEGEGGDDEADAAAAAAPAGPKPYKMNARKRKLAALAAAGEGGAAAALPVNGKKAQKKDEEGDKEQEEEEEEEEDVEAEVAAGGQDMLGKDVDMSTIKLPEWEGYGIHPLLLLGIQDCGFTSPTPIQTQALPPAIISRKDIIGAAETGSGKTLAFGLPIINALLQEHDRRAEYTSKQKFDQKKQLRCLILSPTRELALQIVAHLKAVTQHCKRTVQCVPIVGGFSQQKQERLLSYGPEIIVGTPGRLWELMSTGNEYLNDLSEVRHLVIDECDRMLEQGHFKELDQILELVNSHLIGEVRDAGEVSEPGEEPAEVDEKQQERRIRQRLFRRQVFLFSATLMLPPDKRRERNFKPKKGSNKKKQTAADDDTVAQLFKRLNLNPKHAVVDLSKRDDDKLVSTLEEAAIECPKDLKDVYLYYFLHRYKGRTIVFVNAVSCLRRLSTILQLLDLPVFPLHANMQQRQRVKSLDRFKEAAHGILLASDVAARGLDITAVNHVVHYQLPRSADIYVHRSGRTARARTEGITIALVSPEDIKNYRTICSGLNKADGLKPFPVDMNLYRALEKRVKVATKLDIELNINKKEKAEEDWFVKQARDADLPLDEDDLDAIGLKALKRKRKVESGEIDPTPKAKQGVRIRELEGQLKHLLAADIKQRNVSRNFITSVTPEILEEVRNPKKKVATDDFKLSTSVGRTGLAKKQGMMLVNNPRRLKAKGARPPKKPKTAQ